MDLSRLYGVQYVRMAPGAAEAVAPYLGVPADEVRELVVDVAVWPEAVRPAPLRAQDGRLIAGDPFLLGANNEGLVLAGRDGGVLLRWTEIRDVQVLGHSLVRGA
jgi:hypothetical protein